MGLWVNYIHLYEESTLGKVFYAGYAGNQVTFAGTYKIEKKSCDYSVCMTREDSLADPKKMTEGTTDYTITFMDFNGSELGSCAYDGKYIYNDTTAVAGVGAENVAFEKDSEGIDSKYGQAQYGYCGEAGVPVIKAELESDTTCTVSINHDGTYTDMMEVVITGTWEVGEDGVTYTLTPDSSSDTGAVFVVSEDGQSATYTPDGGEAVTLKVKNEKPSNTSDFSDEVAVIAKKYDVQEYQHGIIFYGASNFRLWEEMENDLKEYKVQNHGFGGSTDEMLVEYADEILYPYHPDIVFLQTGSNDYVDLSGSDEEKVDICMDFKKEMYEEFHEKLPETKFVVMSGLLLPGRSQYTELTQKINESLKKLCDETDYLYFVDASDMTFDGTNYADELFISDGIHLNHDGQLQWCEKYIRPQIERIMEETGETKEN